MKDLIIFGGSNFIHEVDLKRIDIDRFDILCINRPVHNIPCHYLVCYDDDFRCCHSQEEVKQIKQQGLNPVFLAPKTQFIHKSSGWTFKKDYISHEDKTLGFCMYTCSSAVNFAYLRGYKNIYFIGVDLKEDNKPFTHWHGVVNKKPVDISSTRQCKNYMYQYKKWLNMYQCNPEVSMVWDIPYCPIDRLYNHQ